MVHIVFNDLDEKYPSDFKQVAHNVIQLSGINAQKNTSGFKVYRLKDNMFLGDYSDYNTVYKSDSDFVQYSNDGSVWIKVEHGEYPYEPTLEEVQEQKIAEMNVAQQSAIQIGINVTLTNGEIEHFTLTDHDQTSLMGLQSQVDAGVEQIPWHTSDETEHCKFYSNSDMTLIISAAMNAVTWHVTYFRDLRIYIRSLQAKGEVESVVYGMEIPAQFQSEPLKAMIAAKTI